MPDYGFHKITLSDEAMFKHWLDQPHIGGWWKDGDTERGLVAKDINNPDIDMRIVTTDGAPMGFIQDYNVHDWPMPQFSDMAADVRGIDTFLGDPAYLGQGHATGYIAARLSELRHYSTLVIDPDPSNTRAIAACKNTGFRPHRVTQCEDGDPGHVMRHP